MGEELSDWIVGVMMSVFGLIGLCLAAGARDDGMAVFGYSLVGFAICFVAGLLRRHFDEREAVRRAAVVAEAAGHV